MKLRSLFLASVVFNAGSLYAAVVSPICPTTSTNAAGADPTGCGVLITIGTSGATITVTGTGPFDNPSAEDTTVGVINNSGKLLSSVTLTATDASGAFGFDGDGIQIFTSANGVPIGSGGATGYEGPTSAFNLAGVDASGGGTLIVNFSPGIAAGGSSYFSLEGDPATAAGGISVSGVPEPSTFGALGAGLFGIVGWIRYRRPRS
jgi:PEP-CTERM motif